MLLAWFAAAAWAGWVLLLILLFVHAFEEAFRTSGKRRGRETAGEPRPSGPSGRRRLARPG